MVLNLNNIDNIFFHPAPIHIGKGVDHLCALIYSKMNLDPFTNSLFVFTNKSHNKVKIIFFDGTGFWLFYKRLDRGAFQWPKWAFDGTVNIEKHELEWFLSGFKSWSPQVRKTYNKSIMF